MRSACHENCNQGRMCTCRPESDNKPDLLEAVSTLVFALLGTAAIYFFCILLEFVK